MNRGDAYSPPLTSPEEEVHRQYPPQAQPQLHPHPHPQPQYAPSPSLSRCRARPTAKNITSFPNEHPFQATPADPDAQAMQRYDRSQVRSRRVSTTVSDENGQVQRQEVSEKQQVQVFEGGESGLKLRLDLNLDIEVELKAKISGDLTLALLCVLHLSFFLFLTPALGLLIWNIRLLGLEVRCSGY
ncbi:hypothetical protein BJY04DRAFT_216705 [Aspergillus karnatakaensis]|uniref:uncharacterized protein n=1 Tax=Aspergillus karnatakaensis TaxID=1810916 RepID=UPI003CCD5F6C